MTVTCLTERPCIISSVFIVYPILINTALCIYLKYFVSLTTRHESRRMTVTCLTERPCNISSVFIVYPIFINTALCTSGMLRRHQRDAAAAAAHWLRGSPSAGQRRARAARASSSLCQQQFCPNGRMSCETHSQDAPPPPRHVHGCCISTAPSGVPFPIGRTNRAQLAPDHRARKLRANPQPRFREPAAPFPPPPPPLQQLLGTLRRSGSASCADPLHPLPPPSSGRPQTPPHPTPPPRKLSIHSAPVRHITTPPPCDTDPRENPQRAGPPECSSSATRGR